MAEKTYGNLNKAAPGQSFDQSGEQSGMTEASHTWRPLLFLNIYRLALAGVLTVICLSGTAPSPLGSHNFTLFSAISLFYLAASIFNMFTIQWQKPAFHRQVFVQTLIDIVAITLLMHASGGVSSGVGMLLIVAIAGGSLLMVGRTGRLFAAIATIAALVEHTFTLQGKGITESAYTQVGLLGAGFFATAILAHVLAERLRVSEALAEQRGVDLANMAQLTEYVIQRMQTGIVVLDGSQRVHLINNSAFHLLGLQDIPIGHKFTEICPPLALQFSAWLQDPTRESSMFQPVETAAEILPRFARLGQHETAGTLVFLENTAVMAQQAQQLKLASLGRLTASIAHEIRNPLGAISHAGQLLNESDNIDSSDKRLTDIIQEHTQRVNTIIENIMQLSRRDHSQPEEFLLRPWLEQFLGEFSASEDISPDHISLQMDPENISVRIDPSQLHQILWNLCHNGLRHSMAQATNQDHPDLELRAGMSKKTMTPFLDVIDHGPGIETDVAEHIFEPFFTTASQGTGLGLYISRELCESNQARLDYLPVEEGGSCFRITFADTRRRQVA